MESWAQKKPDNVKMDRMHVNFGGVSTLMARGYITAEDALVRSRNTSSVRVGNYAGLEKVNQTAIDVGFIQGGDKGVVVLSNTNASVTDIGIHLLHPASAPCTRWKLPRMPAYSNSD